VQQELAESESKLAESESKLAESESKLAAANLKLNSQDWQAAPRPEVARDEQHEQAC
jgi:hypothetical protein